MKKRRASHLRLVKGGKSKAPPVLEFELDDMTSAGVRKAFVVRFGPQCSAYFVRALDKDRKAKKRPFDGSFFFHLEALAEKPPWFEIAIAFLRGYRARRWLVHEWVERGIRRYRIEWVSSRRELPPAIRRN